MFPQWCVATPGEPVLLKDDRCRGNLMLVPLPHTDPKRKMRYAAVRVLSTRDLNDRRREVPRDLLVHARLCGLPWARRPCVVVRLRQGLAAHRVLRLQVLAPSGAVETNL